MRDPCQVIEHHLRDLLTVLDMRQEPATVEDLQASTRVHSNERVCLGYQRLDRLASPDHQHGLGQRSIGSPSVPIQQAADKCCRRVASVDLMRGCIVGLDDLIGDQRRGG